MFDSIFANSENLSIYPVVSLIIFMVMFITVIVWLFRLKKDYFAKMENLPLE